MPFRPAAFPAFKCFKGYDKSFRVKRGVSGELFASVSWSSFFKDLDYFRLVLGFLFTSCATSFGVAAATLAGALSLLFNLLMFFHAILLL